MISTKDSIVRARIDEQLKNEAVDVLRRNGLEMSDAIRLFLTQVVRRDGLPFAVRGARGLVRRSPDNSGRAFASRVSNDAELEQLQEHRMLSATDRLAAFVSHSRQMAQLQAAGELLRARPRKT
jgi:DNA-damage-inducible protein J